jgi:hypothetical protein
LDGLQKKPWRARPASAAGLGGRSVRETVAQTSVFCYLLVEQVVTQSKGSEMKTLRKITLRMAVFCAVTVLVSIVCGVVFSQDTNKSETRATMRGIFVTLTTAYKFSLDTEAFEDPANHMRIQGTLQALQANAMELERHGGGLNPSFGYLRRSLARDANDALDRFNQGQFMGSRFVISKITENCVTCHTKLPKGEAFSIGDAFLESLEIKKVPAAERFNIELATRQFDAAVSTYEELFDDPDMSPENLALLSAFEGYLRVCIGAFNDPQKAVPALEKYITRKDVSEAEKDLVRGWIRSLKQVDLTVSVGNELLVSRDLIANAEASRKFPSDRSSLVDYLVTTTLLHRYIETGPTDKNDVAEAYYLMGVAESRITRSYWISETDFLLEQAIREAPKSPVARQAFAFLSEYTISAHMESSAREVSDDLRANLDELRVLIEE